MPVSELYVNAAATLFAAIDVGQALKNIGIFVLVAIIFLLLMTNDTIRSLFAVGLGLYQLFWIVAAIGVGLYLLWRLFSEWLGPVWSVAAIVALALLILLIARINAVSKARAQVKARAEYFAHPEKYAQITRAAAGVGLCMNCYGKNVTVNQAAHTITCHDCGAVIKIPN